MEDFNSEFIGLLLASSCRECGVSVSLAISPSKRFEAVLARKIFVLSAQRLGFRGYEIGWAINRTKGAVSKLFTKAKALSIDDAFNRQITNTITRAGSWYSATLTKT